LKKIKKIVPDNFITLDDFEGEEGLVVRVSLEALKKGSYCFGKMGESIPGKIRKTKTLPEVKKVLGKLGERRGKYD